MARLVTVQARQAGGGAVNPRVGRWSKKGTQWMIAPARIYWMDLPHTGYFYGSLDKAVREAEARKLETGEEQNIWGGRGKVWTTEGEGRNPSPVGDKWSLAWEAHYAKYGTQAGAREYADKVAGKKGNPRRQWKEPVISINEVTLSETLDEIHPWTVHSSWVDPVDFRTKHEALQYISREFGDVRVEEDLLPGKGNPFMSELISGVGTGTGLAISAALAGPLLVKRMKGAARELGLVKRGNPTKFDWYEFGFASGESDRRAGDAGLNVDPMTELDKQFDFTYQTAHQYHGFPERKKVKAKQIFQRGYYQAYSRRPRHPRSKRGSV